MALKITHPTKRKKGATAYAIIARIQIDKLMRRGSMTVIVYDDKDKRDENTELVSTDHYMIGADVIEVSPTSKGRYVEGGLPFDEVFGDLSNPIGSAYEYLKSNVDKFKNGEDV